MKNQKRINLSKMIKNSKGILFDMDGIITNSMPSHAKAWIKSFKKYYGINVSINEIFNREGEKSEKSVKQILKIFNIKVNENEIKDFLNFKISLFNNNGPMKLFKKINHYLKILKKTKRLALVTGTQKKEIEKRLSKKTASLFDVIITSDDVTKGKPHPMPYKRALKALSLKPYECIVIENAPFGIKSGINAGIKVIAIPTSLPKEYLLEADFILKNHEELYKAIKPS